MSATQLTLDFSAPIPLSVKTIPRETGWQDVTDLTRCIGFQGRCLVSTGLHDYLDDQTLYDALWTACFSLSLDNTNCALFTLELDGKPVQFKIIQTSHAVCLGRVADF
jgi:hypothetical protein